jgi:membrane protein DedA with SNARE-associated domain
MALFVSRFLPGVRALVPPVAGALRIPPWRVFIIFCGASAIWYGAITLIAYRVGADWPTLQAKMQGWQRSFVIAAAIVAVIGIVAWLIARRRSSR